MYFSFDKPRRLWGDPAFQIIPLDLKIGNQKVGDRKPFGFDFNSQLTLFFVQIWQLWCMKDFGVGIYLFGFSITLNWG